MTFIEQKLKHLDLIQDVIKRMASNSFQLKTWTITIVSAILVLASKDNQGYLIPLAAVLIFIFWGLDAYFLRVERVYRNMYNTVRKHKESEGEIDFDLNYILFEKPEDNWFKVFCSATLFIFYALLLVVIVGVIVLIYI